VLNFFAREIATRIRDTTANQQGLRMWGSKYLWLIRIFLLMTSSKTTYINQ